LGEYGQASAPAAKRYGRAIIMEQDLIRIEKLYDKITWEYAEKFIDEHDKKPKDQEILHRFAQEIRGRKPVWDFGCGPGQTTQYLKNLGIDISGLDLSERILERARIIHPGIHFRKGNILALEFENESIAAAIAFYAIVHFSEEQVRRACHEVFRVLQPGGIFLLTFHIGKEAIHVEDFLGKNIDIDFMFFTTEFMSSCLRKCGFKEIEVIEREPYPGIEYESQRAYTFAIKPVAQ
jgi:SAM-dependent methyltransferase